jgi:hypothetical protein
MSNWDATASHMSSTVICAISYGGGSTTNGAPTCQ